MTPKLIFYVFLLYTLLIFFVTWLTSRRADNESFFRGNRKSPWYVVSYGMIGASLSGVTFMSVPGWVQTTHFTYLVMVLGFLVGYIVIATVLLPLYYRLNLTSIYSYLGQRFGKRTYKTGASFFILSRTLGATLRMFLMINVLYEFVFKFWNIPFWVVAGGFIILILLYTLEGGIRTIVWTDTLQTTFMLLAVIVSTILISKNLNLDFRGFFASVSDSGYTTIFETDPNSKQFWLKQFLSGVFVCIAMTGLDQEMMQKNLSCRTLKDSQKNVLSFSLVLLVINAMFLLLGSVLALYATRNGITVSNTDQLFPEIAINHLGVLAGLFFVVGLVSAAYPSADGALTSLTTSFVIDILGIQRRQDMDEDSRKRVRKITHLSFAFLFFLLVVYFRANNNDAIINVIYDVCSYTYGPILGFYLFGLFTSRSVKDKAMPFVAVLSPVICWILQSGSQRWFGGYTIGFELLLINGALTFLGMLIFGSSSKNINHESH